MTKIFLILLLAFIPFFSMFSSEYSDFLKVEKTIYQAKAITNEQDSPNDLLHKGILNDSPAEIKKAIEMGANIHIGKDGQSPILYAVLLKKSIAVQELLNFGANPNIKYAGYTLAQHSVRLDDIRSALAIIRHGGNFSGYIDSVKRNMMDYAFLILSRAPSISAKTDILSLIEELILHGYDIHSPNQDTNVWYSAITHSGRTEDAIRLLINYGANPNQIIFEHDRKITWTPLMRAVYFNNQLAAEILLEAGANINQSANPYPHVGGPYTPLSYALTFQVTSIVQFLISHGAKL